MSHLLLYNYINSVTWDTLISCRAFTCNFTSDRKTCLSFQCTSANTTESKTKHQTQKTTTGFWDLDTFACNEVFWYCGNLYAVHTVPRPTYTIFIYFRYCKSVYNLLHNLFWTYLHFTTVLIFALLVRCYLHYVVSVFVLCTVTTQLSLI